MDKIRVLDIGARYGLHPTWKAIPLPIEFHLVEADPVEAKRLKKRYEGASQVFVHHTFLSIEDEAWSTLKIRKNPAISGSFARSDISPEYWNEKRDELIVLDEIEVPNTNINQFRQQVGAPFDFLKIDIEGGEADLLETYEHLDETLGIRSEVSFIGLYGAAEGSFSRIHKRLVDRGFTLLNMDYQGKGAKHSNLLSAIQRFGSLQETDAVWLKTPSFDDPHQLTAICLFCLRNNAVDLALYHLLAFVREGNFLPENLLTAYIRDLVAQHFYNLKWEPNINVKELAAYYEFVFKAEYPDMDKFQSNIRFNPFDVPLN